jgi:D-alanyl-lipoteichoic acid acyltransferase DltB (MBOAT superfamily)
VLLLASYLFYASWSPVYLLLIGALTLMNSVVALGMAYASAGSRSSAPLLWVGVALNLLALGYYKYVGFLLTNLAEAVGWLGLSGAPTPFSPVLPLGLSFFTFEFIHYLVDVRNGQPPIRSLVQFAVFAAFFPTQVAGPIKRFEAFLPQMLRPAPFSWANAGEGMRLIVVGLFKKIAVADNLAPLVEVGFLQVSGGVPALGPVDAWSAVLAFTLQIYFDFSGYTDIGRGSALLLGFTVPENFRRPYLSASISEFWRRWHISLSTWLRDYLYIPLGGNRGHQERNLFVTMLLGGLWHGANWTFVIWGAYHGLLLVGYHALRRWRRAPGAARNRPPARSALVSVLGWLLTFLLVAVGWVFFRADSFMQAVGMLGSLAGLAVGAPAVLVLGQRLTIVVAVGGMLALEWLVEQREVRAADQPEPERSAARMLVLRPVGLTLLFMLTLLLQPPTAPRFIYFQF